MTMCIVPHFAFYALPDLFAIGKGENTSSPAASLSHATLLQPGRQVSLSVAEGEVLLSSAPTAPDPLCCSMADRPSASRTRPEQPSVEVSGPAFKDWDLTGAKA